MPCNFIFSHQKFSKEQLFDRFLIEPKQQSL